MSGVSEQDYPNRSPFISNTPNIRGSRGQEWVRRVQRKRKVDEKEDQEPRPDLPEAALVRPGKEEIKGKDPDTLITIWEEVAAVAEGAGREEQERGEVKMTALTNSHSC